MVFIERPVDAIVLAVVSMEETGTYGYRISLHRCKKSDRRIGIDIVSGFAKASEKMSVSV